MPRLANLRGWSIVMEETRLPLSKGGKNLFPNLPSAEVQRQKGAIFDNFDMRGLKERI